MNRRISVVIPCRNEIKNIRACIDGILNQTVKVDEIIVVDSGSTDGTLDVLMGFSKVKIVSISSKSFNHGLTRNLGISHATGDIIILTVGDAKAYDRQWIESLLEGFVDESVMAVCGTQVVEHDLKKNPLEWFRPISSPKLKHISYTSQEYEALSGLEKFNLTRWDDVNAAYRAKALKKIPFRKTSYGEDFMWANDALSVGMSLVYQDKSRVYHYHDTDFKFHWKRTITVNYYVNVIFGIIRSRQKLLLPAMRIVYSIMKLDNLTFFKKMYWTYYNLSNLISRFLSSSLVVIMFWIFRSRGLKMLNDLFCVKVVVPKK